MSALDTNVLVRYLMQDEPEEGKAASDLIRQGARSGSPMFIPITATLELEWVLRFAFGLDKAVVSKAFHALLRALEPFRIRRCSRTRTGPLRAGEG